MNALLKAELLRLASRRLLVVLLVCMAALAALGAAVEAGSTGPVTAQEIRDSREAWKQEKISWEEACGDNATGKDCEGWEVTSDPEQYLRIPLGFGEYAETVISFGSPLLLLAVAVLAASLVGAEFASGNIGTQLLFTPRRIPLMLSKVVAATLGGVALAAAHLGAVLAFCALTFLSLRGAHDMTAGIDLPLLLGRTMVLALLMAVMGAAVAMAVGSTLITAGVFAVVFLGSIILGDSIPGSSVWQLLLPSNILWAMMSGEYEVYGWLTMNYDDWQVAQVITYDWALGYTVVGTVLLLGVAALWFRRRDITR
ncbi:MAG: ABC transporter permease subunit [Arachnia sp.]